MTESNESDLPAIDPSWFIRVHGETAIIQRVLEHSEYDSDTDRLVFAGDAIEVGHDSWGCL
jgi:hypothetical protein